MWRFLLLSTGLAGFGAAGTALWLWFGPWPVPRAEPVTFQPDAVLILGGGGRQRAEHGIAVAARFPSCPIIVTGDNGFLWEIVHQNIDDPARLHREMHADSTYENATLTEPMLKAFEARNVLLVTDWFHAPRALATFRKVQPGRRHAVDFAPKPEVLRKWDRNAQRRERFATVWYLLRYGIGMWRSG